MRRLKKIEFGEGSTLALSYFILGWTESLNKIVFPANTVFSSTYLFSYSYLTDIYICGIDPYPDDSNHFYKSYSSNINIYVRKVYQASTFLGQPVNYMTDEENICRFYRKPLIITCKQNLDQDFKYLFLIQVIIFL